MKIHIFFKKKHIVPSNLRSVDWQVRLNSFILVFFFTYLISPRQIDATVNLMNEIGFVFLFYSSLFRILLYYAYTCAPNISFSFTLIYCCESLFWVIVCWLQVKKSRCFPTNAPLCFFWCCRSKPLVCCSHSRLTEILAFYCFFFFLFHFRAARCLVCNC